MRNNSHNLNFFVKVKGRVVDEYKHHGKTFIEGRKGSEYTLEFYNGSSIRRNVVISVDGLNITTGDTNWEKGYIADPWQTISIPGWKIDQTKAAKFEFNSVPKSYNQHNDSGDKNNVGVIGCLVFDEIKKPDPIPIPVYHHYYQNYPRTPWVNPWEYHHWDNPLWLNNSSAQSWGSSLAGVGSSMNLQNASGMNSCNFVAKAASQDFCASENISERTRSAPDPELVQQSLGTKWGERTEFKTYSVSMDCEKNASSTILIFYDSRKGLENRGINFHQKHKFHAIPNAFPGLKTGCPLPR